MATECVSGRVPSDADVVVKIKRKPDGRQLRVVVEYDPELVETVSLTTTPVDGASHRKS